MSQQTNPQAVISPSKELFSLLYKKASEKTFSHVKNLLRHEGLEALRVVKYHLNKRDGQRLNEEFERLAEWEHIKIANIRNFGTTFAEWEASLKRFEDRDMEYKIGKFQRRQILYKAMPDEIKRLIVVQLGMKMLTEYDDVVDFIKKCGNKFKSRQLQTS